MQVRETPPFAPVLMESTRAIGYSLEAAIADIIDNSVAAKAGKVQLSFFPVGDAYVSILDNGTGMDDCIFVSVPCFDRNQQTGRSGNWPALGS